LDLKNSEDFKIFENVISKSDILIQNLAPGAFDRLGLNLDFKENLKDNNLNKLIGSNE